MTKNVVATGPVRRLGGKHLEVHAFRLVILGGLDSVAERLQIYLDQITIIHDLQLYRIGILRQSPEFEGRRVSVHVRLVHVKNHIVRVIGSRQIQEMQSVRVAKTAQDVGHLETE